MAQAFCPVCTLSYDPSTSIDPGTCDVCIMGLPEPEITQDDIENEKLPLPYSILDEYLKNGIRPGSVDAKIDIKPAENTQMCGDPEPEYTEESIPWDGGFDLGPWEGGSGIIDFPEDLKGVDPETEEDEREAAALSMTQEEFEEGLRAMGLLSDFSLPPAFDLKGVGIEERETFPSGAVRSKLSFRYDLICPIALKRLAETYGEGAVKYGDHNWCKGMPKGVIINHVIDHLQKILAGDTSEDHAAHAAWGLFALMHFEEGCEHHKGGIHG